MNKLLSHRITNEYSDQEWTCMKLSIVAFWLGAIGTISVNHSGIPYPTGIFSLVNASVLASKYTARVFLLIGFILGGLYVTERFMKAATLLMFLLSLFAFTLEESSGFLNRHYLYTAIFFVQFLAYLSNSKRLKEERVQFAIQIIAAGYVLAGISKLRQSGLEWVTDAPLVSIQIIKGYCFNYFNTGNVKEFELGTQHANFILRHKYAVESIFAASLFLELFAWIAIINRRAAFVYGLLLFAMHIGIKYLMNILIGSIAYPMVVFTINPLRFVYVPLKRLVNWVKQPIVKKAGAG